MLSDYTGKKGKAMMKPTNRNTQTYYVEDGFYVDIVSFMNDAHNRQLEAWLYHESYGIKMLMFGTEIEVPGGNNSYGEFADTVEFNLINGNNYISLYRDEYMD